MAINTGANEVEKIEYSFKSAIKSTEVQVNHTSKEGY